MRPYRPFPGERKRKRELESNFNLVPIGDSSRAGVGLGSRIWLSSSNFRPTGSLYQRQIGLRVAWPTVTS